MKVAIVGASGAVGQEFLLQLAGFLLVIRLLGLLHEGNHVAHAEYAVCDTLRMEDVEGLHLLACGNEFDRLARYRRSLSERLGRKARLVPGLYKILRGNILSSRQFRQLESVDCKPTGNHQYLLRHHSFPHAIRFYA